MYKQNGTSLIEILISFLLLSLLLLGIDAAQITCLQTAKANYYFAVAAQQLHLITERLSIYPAQELISDWNKQNQQLLPQGKGEINGAYPNYTVSISWGKKEHLQIVL